MKLNTLIHTGNLLFPTYFLNLIYTDVYRLRLLSPHIQLNSMADAEESGRSERIIRDTDEDSDSVSAEPEREADDYTTSSNSRNNMEPILLVHGGAGEVRDPTIIPHLLAGVKQAAIEGHKVLSNTGIVF